jgi:predicted Zn-dependent protease
LGWWADFRAISARGIATLSQVARQGNVNRVDATIFLAAIYRREHRSAEAVGMLRPLIPLLPRNYLLRLELAEMYGDLADYSAALDLLNQVEQLRRAHAQGYETLNADLVRQVRERVLANVEKNGVVAGG